MNLKRLLSVLTIILIFLVPYTYGDAIQVDIFLAGLRNSSGGILTGGTVDTFAAGTSTRQNCWYDKNKVSAVNHIVLNSKGQAQIYADGWYKFVIKDYSGVTVNTWDNLIFSSTYQQWTPVNGTLVYQSSSTFTITGDATLSLATDMYIKANVTAGTIYGQITSSTYNGTITTVISNWFSGGLDSGLSAVYGYIETIPYVIGNTSGTLDYLQLKSGVSVTGIDNDANFVANSDLNLVTQAAIKTYVDTAIAGAISGSTNTTSILIPPLYKNNLRIYPTTSGTSAYQVTVQVDSVSLTSAGTSIIKSGVSVTANINTSGANGLDTGTESGTTIYYIHLVCDSSGTTVISLLSLSKTSPTLPATYIYTRCVGEVYNNASSNFYAMYRYDDDVTFINPILVYSNVSLPSYTSYNTYALPAPLDILAQHGDVSKLHLEAGAATNSVTDCILSGTTNPVTCQFTVINSADGSPSNVHYGPTGLYNASVFFMPYNGTGNIYASSPENSDHYHQSLYLWGYHRVR